MKRAPLGKMKNEKKNKSIKGKATQVPLEKMNSKKKQTNSN